MKKTPDYNRFALYLWIGLIWFLLWSIYNVSKPSEFPQRTVNEIWRDVYVILYNILAFEYVFPFIGKKRKYVVYNFAIGFFLVWIILMLGSYGLYGWRQLGIALGVFTPFKNFENIDVGLEYHAGVSIGSLFFFGIISHIYFYQQLKRAAVQLKVEKQEAELNYLKSQTNPHFLFNTLNNIYSLSRDKSDGAPEAILKLSKILRFMLYEAGGNYIPIENELKIINDYISLESLRYDESLRINFSHDLEDRQQAIPPLLLMPLVENAFKHGTSETRANPFVEIHLLLKNRRLNFKVRNSSEGKPEDAIVENIGLSNLRRQLELLYTDYKLNVYQGKGEFIAELKINLQSHV